MFVFESMSRRGATLPSRPRALPPMATVMTVRG
jgi:hypothetical protein